MSQQLGQQLPASVLLNFLLTSHKYCMVFLHVDREVLGIHWQSKTYQRIAQKGNLRQVIFLYPSRTILFFVWDLIGVRDKHSKRFSNPSRKRNPCKGAGEEGCLQLGVLN